MSGDGPDKVILPADETSIFAALSLLIVIVTVEKNQFVSHAAIAITMTATMIDMICFLFMEIPYLL